MENPTQTPDSKPTPTRGNALKHGLRATDEVLLQHLRHKDRQTLRNLRDQLAEQYDPRTPLENLLLDKIAIQNFRLLRLYRLEYAAGNESSTAPLEKNSVLYHLDRLARYDWRIERQLKLLHNRLRTVIKGRETFANIPRLCRNSQSLFGQLLASS